MLLYILISIAIISLMSLTGAFFLVPLMQRTLFYLVSFAIGALLGVAFLELLPEVQHFPIVLGSILFFFLLEKVFFWHHHHHDENPKRHLRHHPYVYLNLVGDGVHNFLDGMVIASSYLTSIPLGVSVTIAIAMHEIPQELGDIGLLLAGGLSRAKALFYNFLTALTAFLGGLLVYFFSQVTSITPWLLAFAAGGFLYIANVDLIPELHKEKNVRKSMQQLFFILLGIGVIWITGYFFHE